MPMSEPLLRSSHAQLAGACDACGRGLVIRFEQHAFPSHLRWTWSAACAGCGKSMNEEGEGMSPRDIRANILATEGEWRLDIRSMSSPSIEAIKAIRLILGLGLKEAKDLWDGAERGGGLRGTRPECEAIAAQLRANRVPVEVVFAGAAASEAPTAFSPLGGAGESWEVVVPGGSAYAIAAIKAIRAAWKLGLKEAKDLWDQRNPENVLPGSRTNCKLLAMELAKAGVPHELRSRA